VRPLYHYCCEHSYQRIGRTGVLLPVHLFVTDKPVPWTGRLVWLTDMATPVRDALGLTSHILSCDRTTHRYRVTDSTSVLPWVKAARTIPREQREDVEGAPGAMPMHWYVSDVGVPVVYDPRRAA
jgi:hypothetical protein